MEREGGRGENEEEKESERVRKMQQERKRKKRGRYTLGAVAPIKVAVAATPLTPSVLEFTLRKPRNFQQLLN